jgi:hypothetical protein
LLRNHPHLSSEAGTIGQKWPQYKRIKEDGMKIVEFTADNKIEFELLDLRAELLSRWS